MTSTANSISFLPFKSIRQNPFRDDKHLDLARARPIQFDSFRMRLTCGKSKWVLAVRVLDSGGNGDASVTADGKRLGLEKKISSLREMVNGLPPAIAVFKDTSPSTFAVALSIAMAVLAIVARQIMLKRKIQSYQGSVADLVRRGQLRSDRAGISKPMKYDDPFNNPFVKIDKSNSTAEIFGKVYHLAPVTLTAEEKSVHQRRRSRAYQWKRPTVFLKEGDSIPADIDPDTVRWIPANHPFATTISDIDEKLAQNNVYQKDGVPFRVKVEHEAMQKKLEALQSEQRFNEAAVSTNLQEQRFNEAAVSTNSNQDFDRTVHFVTPEEQDSFADQQNGLARNGVDPSADSHQKN